MPIDRVVWVELERYTSHDLLWVQPKYILSFGFVGEECTDICLIDGRVYRVKGSIPELFDKIGRKYNQLEESS